MGDITQLAAADKELRNLKIGQQLSWTLTADGELQRLTWEVSRRETRTYDRTAANGFKMTSEMQQGEWVNNLLKGAWGELCCQRQKRRFNQRRSERSD